MFRNLTRTNPRRLPGCDVLEFEDAEQVRAHLHQHPLLEACCLNGSHCVLLRAAALPCSHPDRVPIRRIVAGKQRGTQLLPQRPRARSLATRNRG